MRPFSLTGSYCGSGLLEPPPNRSLPREGEIWTRAMRLCRGGTVGIFILAAVKRNASSRFGR